MAVSASTSLSIAVAHAISFLVGPLIGYQSETTIDKLQTLLTANLTAYYAPTWVPKEPLRGSGRRCMTLSPFGLPPRIIYSACMATNVQWFDWILLLGNREFDFFVDPGCVSVRVGKKGSPDCRTAIVWSEENHVPTVAVSAAIDEERIQAQFKAQAEARAKSQKKTFAQQVLEEDVEEELFAMIANEVRLVSGPTWITPILDQFPIPTRSSSPLSTISTHSRSSSRSSNSSSGFSLASGQSFGSITSVSTSSIPDRSILKQSRREKARQARVFVDTTKKEVTPYDGGKTTVLTGGVMLGGGPKPKVSPTKPAMSASNSWRTVRA